MVHRDLHFIGECVEELHDVNLPKQRYMALICALQRQCLGGGGQEGMSRQILPANRQRLCQHGGGPLILKVLSSPKLTSGSESGAATTKQFEVTSLANTELAEQGAAPAPAVEVASSDGDLSRKYQESRYYKVDPTSDDLAALVKPNAFWRDYADFVLTKGGGKGFLSKNFGFAAGNTTEALLALSVIALPFRGDHLARVCVSFVCYIRLCRSLRLFIF